MQGIQNTKMLDNPVTQSSVNKPIEKVETSGNMSIKAKNINQETKFPGSKKSIGVEEEINDPSWQPLTKR